VDVKTRQFATCWVEFIASSAAPGLWSSNFATSSKSNSDFRPPLPTSPVAAYPITDDPISLFVCECFDNNLVELSGRIHHGSIDNSQSNFHINESGSSELSTQSMFRLTIPAANISSHNHRLKITPTSIRDPPWARLLSIKTSIGSSMFPAASSIAFSIARIAGT
jgi:hypothetical protein